MKQLLENWKTFINEKSELEESDSLVRFLTKFGNPDMTVGEMTQKINQAREDYANKKNTENTKFAIKAFGKFAVGEIPVVGTVLSGGSVVKNILNKANKEMDENPKAAKKLATTPLLDLVDVDIHLTETIDEDLLKILDKQYENYINNMPDKMLVRHIEDVNDYIRRKIDERTKRNVVIQDLNPED